MNEKRGGTLQTSHWHVGLFELGKGVYVAKEQKIIPRYDFLRGR